MRFEDLTDNELAGITKFLIHEDKSLALICYLGNSESGVKENIMQEFNIDETKYNKLILNSKQLGLVQGENPINLGEKGKLVYDILKHKNSFFKLHS